MGQAASCRCLTMMSLGGMRGWGSSQSRWAGGGGAVHGLAGLICDSQPPGNIQSVTHRCKRVM